MTTMATDTTPVGPSWKTPPPMAPPRPEVGPDPTKPSMETQEKKPGTSHGSFITFISALPRRVNLAAGSRGAVSMLHRFLSPSRSASVDSSDGDAAACPVRTHQGRNGLGGRHSVSSRYVYAETVEEEREVVVGVGGRPKKPLTKGCKLGASFETHMDSSEEAQRLKNVGSISRQLVRTLTVQQSPYGSESRLDPCPRGRYATYSYCFQNLPPGDAKGSNHAGVKNMQVGMVSGVSWGPVSPHRCLLLLWSRRGVQL